MEGLKEMYNKSTDGIKDMVDKKFNILSTLKDASDVAHVMDENNVDIDKTINFAIVILSSMKAYDIKSYRKIIRKLNTATEVFERIGKPDLKMDEIIKDPLMAKVFSGVLNDM